MFFWMSRNREDLKKTRGSIHFRFFYVYIYKDPARILFPSEKHTSVNFSPFPDHRKEIFRLYCRYKS